ncbi:MAG TPA: TIGR02679 family protein [Streptosporangiaceae bacterium]|nr:TIGR02679 family protein [Streptosporangiaceae bacterium]
MTGGARGGASGAGGTPGADRYRGPEYRRLLAAARRSLERTGGGLAGRISVPEPDDAERKAIIGITGVHQPAGTRRLTVSLADLDAALRRGTGLGLVALLADLGGPLRDRPAETASLAAARAALTAAAEASPLNESSHWYRAWLADLRRDGTLTRLATQGDDVLLGQAVRTLEYLAARPVGGPPITLPALAAHLTGGTKSLNHGTTLATLILRALAAQAGASRPASAAERRELWDRSGVLVDDLASRVLVLNITAQGDGLAEWLTGAARYGTPFQVTLHQLATHPIRLRPPRIFACENPAVLRRACQELGAACPPLVCTEGRPSTAFHRLAGIAVGAGAELWYHGDFDWPGVAIAADIIARYGARPWRMNAGDYLPAVEANGTCVALDGEPVATPWDPGLCETMRATGCAVYEESVTDPLLADLSHYGHAV